MEPVAGGIPCLGCADLSSCSSCAASSPCHSSGPWWQERLLVGVKRRSLRVKRLPRRGW